MENGGALGGLFCDILDCWGESSLKTIRLATGVSGGDMTTGFVGMLGGASTGVEVVGGNTSGSAAGGMIGEQTNWREVDGPIGDCIGTGCGAGVVGGGGLTAGECGICCSIGDCGICCSIRDCGIDCIIGDCGIGGTTQ